MSCRIITSPVTGQEVTSKTWNDFRNLVNTDKEADNLYAQITSSEFKSWFGDWINNPGGENVSKVVNEYGEPLVVYHGTEQKFNIFEKKYANQSGFLGEGFYFGLDKSAVEKFANISELDKEMFTDRELAEYVKPVFLSIKNDNEGTVKDGEAIVYNTNQIKSVFNQGEYSSDSNNIYLQKESASVEKEGVVELFKDYPELAKFGTPEQYSQYLDTIFPDSQVKDIVYHISPNKFDRFDNKYIGSKKEKVSPDNSMGIFFSKNKNYIKTQDTNNELGDTIYPTLVNLKNPYPNWLSELRVFLTGNLLDESSRKEYESYKKWMVDNNYDGFLEESKRELVVVFDAKDTHILGSKQDIEGFKEFINKSSLKESAATEKANAELDNKVQRFLEGIGVSVNTVNNITDAQGNPINAIAKADMLKKVIDVVQGRADITTLPEEAAHFFVEMLSVDSPLYKEMLNSITGFQIYKETVDLYKNDKLYRNANGTINFDKLKKEAMGKLIAQHIVKQSSEERPEKLIALNKWWDKVWNFIKKIFSKAGETNPFEQAAAQILAADTTGLNAENIGTETYLQIDPRINKIEEDQSKLILDNSVDPVTKQKRHIYKYDGKQVKGSVTSIKVDAYMKSIFPTDRRAERQKEIDLLKAEYGDLIHETIQDIIDSYVDPTTHLVRPVPATSTSKYANEEFYTKLDEYVKELISTFPAGSKFMREVKIYDPVQDMAGSIDFLIIEPDGTVNIYDWKSQEIGFYQTDVKTYKEKAYRIQLSEYKKILQTIYGFDKFGKMRAIPIKTVFNYTGTGANKELASLKEIEIGSVDPAYIPGDKNYLLPITLKEEAGEDEQLQKLLVKLGDVMERLEAKKFKGDEKLKREEELKNYRNAIRDLHLRGDIRTFVMLGTYEAEKYRNLINTNTLSPKDALESLAILGVFSNTTYNFEKYMLDLKAQIKNSTNEAEKQAIQKVIDDYNSMNSNVNSILGKLEIEVNKIANEFATAEAGITNILSEEKEIKGATALFTQLSDLPTRAAQVFSRVLSRAQNKRDYLYKDYHEKIVQVKKDLEKWASGKGLSGIDMFKGMLEIDEKGNWTGNFLSKYKKEFYSQRDKAIKEHDVKWIADNMEFDNKKYEEDAKKRWEFYQSIVYDADPQINVNKQAQAFNAWVENHNVTAKLKDGGVNTLALFNKNNQYLKPDAKWESDKWKELNKAENAPLLAAYTQFQTLVRDSEKAGILDEYSPRFIPNMHATKLDQLVFGGDFFSKKGILESLEVVDGRNYAPQVDPLTGKVMHKIPAHFIRDIGVEKEDGTVDYSNKSMDLFKVFDVWAAQLASYEAMSDIEDISHVLVHVERNKGHLVTDTFGNVINEDGAIKTAVGNENNAKMLENFVNFYLYNELNGKMSDTKIKIGGKEYSGSKALQWFMRFFSLKTLALNPISGTAQFVGGTGNAFFQASKGILFNSKDWAESTYLISKADKKSLALLHFTGVLLEDTKNATANETSVSKIVNANTLDKLYFIQRAADRAVQYPVAIALMKNSMVDENGAIVDISKYVKAKYNYNTEFYNLPEAKRKELKDKIEAEVTKLKEEKSIFSTAKIENDKLVIPGVDVFSKDWADFRSKIKKVHKNILGNSTRDDINQIRTSQLGMAMMQFRSWMPQMVKERTGKLRYDKETDTYTFGKARLFLGEIFSKRGVYLAKSIINLSGNSMIESAKQKYLIERAKALEQGEEFNITEGEFIDMYIGNIRSMMKELLVILGFASLLLYIKPSGDDDDEYKGLRKYAARAVGRFNDEFSFYYLPTSFTDLVNKPLPVIGLANDFIYFTNNTFKEGYGFVTDDAELQEKAHPLKYASKLMPVLKEGINMRAVFDDDFRKEWGIKIN